MATYYVWDGGSNGAGTDWTSAKTTLAGAIALASASGDVIKVAHTHTGDNALGADTTWTVLNNISIISVDKTSSDAPTAMGTSAWLGSSTTSIALTLAGAYKAFCHGITFRNAGSTNKAFAFGTSDGSAFELNSCYIWLGTSSASATISFGPASTLNSCTRVADSTLRFGATGQGILSIGVNEFVGCAVATAGSAPTTLFGDPVRSSHTTVVGSDLSRCGAGTLVANQASFSTIFKFIQCKLGTNYVARATPSSPANLSNGETWIMDCSSGDTHGLFGYYNGQGALTSDTGIYVTSGPAQQSWKIVTTSNNSIERPFTSPWISYWNTATSSITPYFDILNSGSSTAYKDNEVWAEFCAKTTSGYTLGTFYTDRMAILGTPDPQATSSLGSGDWTGEGGTSWFGKIDSGSSFTPAEAGEIMGRVRVAAASATVYIDPVIK